MLPTRRVLFVAALAMVGMALSGCGPSYPETIPVTGSVSLDGKPVAGAAVVFTPEEGHLATGTTDGSGQFELSTFQLGDGALPGKHRVTVAKTTVDPKAGGKIVFLIPQEFGNLQTSQLTCDVQKEMGPVQFDLKPGTEPAPNPPPAEVTDTPDNGDASPQEQPKS